MPRPRTQDRVGLLEEELSRLEREMAALQGTYQEKAEELQRLRSLKRQLGAYPLPDVTSLTWVAVCRAMGWPAKNSGAHRTVKGQDPTLHALLHLCVFEAYCRLDGASYVP